MIRGTTPTCTFGLPFETSIIDKLYITFYQTTSELFTLENEDCVCTGSTITADLTQTQTLLMNAEYPVSIQIRILTTDGDAIASNIIHTSVDAILKDGEI